MEFVVENICFIFILGLAFEGDSCWNKFFFFFHKTWLQWKKSYNQHLGYMRNKDKSKATGQHFNLQGHGMKKMKICILKQVNSHDPLYASERERLLIRKFNTFHSGINKEPKGSVY